MIGLFQGSGCFMMAIMMVIIGMMKINQKYQKPSIKEELLPIAWRPSRYWDWCISEDEKQEIIRSKKFFDLKRSTK